MPKVLRIINRLNLGGPTFNAAYLSRFMAPEFETMLVAGMIDESEESSEFITRQMDLHPVYVPEMYREINLWKDRQAYKKIGAIIDEFKPDIVHTHAAKAGALGRLAAFERKVPVILHTFHGHVFHSYFGPLKTRVFLEIERYVARKSTRIIAISQKQKQELGQVYRVAPPEKIEVIPLGFDLERFHTGQPAKRRLFRDFYQVGEDEIAISLIGRMVPVKNHRLFLEVIRFVQSATRRKVRFFVVGDGEERQNILKMATEMNLPFTWYPTDPRPALLTFCSWRKDADVVMAGSDIIALTSLNEGTPVSLIEAQAAGKPVVTTNVGGVTDIVVEQETALIADNNDPDMFSFQLLRLIEEDDLRQRMSGQAGTHVLQSFSYQRLIADTAALYRRLLAENLKSNDK